MKKTILMPMFLALLTMSFPGQAFAQDALGLSGAVKQETMRHKGLDRTYRTYIPLGDLEKPPLIIVLHGSRGTGSGIREASASQFDRLADRERCIVVYPDGYKKHWNDCRTTLSDDAHKESVDDVGFIREIIDSCEEKWRIDPSRVYVAGLSNGGHMCFRLATEIPDRIAGMAIIGASMPEPEISRCATPQPGIPVAFINGTEDPINPFEGGMVRIMYLISRGRVLSSLDSARMWIRPDNRGKQPLKEKLYDRDPADGISIERLTWPGDMVALYIVNGGGHTIPGGTQFLPGFVVGRVSQDMDTAVEVWRFFQEHPRRR